MSITAFNRSNKVYLGYCSLKGHLYSVQTSKANYIIVSINYSNITTLINYSAEGYIT